MNLKYFLFIVPVLFADVTAVCSPADFSSPDIEAMRSSPDYPLMSIDQKNQLRKQTIAWLQTIQNDAFADCHGKQMTLKLHPENANDGAPMLEIEGRDAGGQSTESESFYLAVVFVQDDVVVLHRPVENQTLATVREAFNDLTGHAIDLSNLRNYMVLRKIPTDHGLNISAMQWLFNRASGQAIATQPMEEKLYQASSVQSCRAIAQKYLDDHKNDFPSDVQIQFDEFGRLKDTEKLEQADVMNAVHTLLKQIEWSAHENANRLNDAILKSKIVDKSETFGTPILTIIDGDIVVLNFDSVNQLRSSPTILISHDITGEDRVSLHNSSRFSTQQMADLEMIPLFEEDGVPPQLISIRQYLKKSYEAFRKDEREFPTQSSLTSLRDFPLMITALKRLGYTQSDQEARQIKIFWQPDWKSENSEGILAYTFANLRHQKNQSSVDGQVWNKIFGDYAMFTNLSGPALDEFSDVAFHEMIHILDFNHALPPEFQTKTSHEEEEKKWEAEYEKSGRDQMLTAMKTSSIYKDAFQKLAETAHWKMLINDEMQKLKAQNSNLTDSGVQALVLDGFGTEFQNTVLGEKLEKVDSSWKKIFVYLHSESERLAWQSQISYLRHEKGMSFQQIVDHMGEAAGYTKGSFNQHPWTIEFYRKLFAET